jgi:hypothetical protein
MIQKQEYLVLVGVEIELLLVFWRPLLCQVPLCLFPATNIFFTKIDMVVLMSSSFFFLIVQLSAFTIFTIFFLNIKQPKKIITSEAMHKTAEQSSNPLIDRLVFILIDALRQDFVYADWSPMEFTKGLIEKGQAMPFIAKAMAPTVTLPRLKALTAGTPPVFLDILANLDETGITGKEEENDSWVRQLYKAGKKLVMLGDDTWIRLFPKEYFIRVDPTTSFYVKVHSCSNGIGHCDC